MGGWYIDREFFFKYSTQYLMNEHSKHKIEIPRLQVTMYYLFIMSTPNCRSLLTRKVDLIN